MGKQFALWCRLIKLLTMTYREIVHERGHKKQQYTIIIQFTNTEGADVATARRKVTCGSYNRADM